MHKKSFDEFIKRFPGFDDTFRAMYSEGCDFFVTPPIVQRGFLVNNVKEADTVFSVAGPVKIVFGDQELANAFDDFIPGHLKHAIRYNKFYEKNVFLVIDEPEMQLMPNTRGGLAPMMFVIQS